MATVKVKLKQKGSIFHDTTQNVTVDFGKVVTLQKTEKVRVALKHGALEEVKEEASTKVPPAATGDDKGNAGGAASSDVEQKQNNQQKNNNGNNGSQKK